MKINRVFVSKGKTAFDQIEFDTRSSVIRNPDGSIVFEMNEIKVPGHWSQVATDILAQKYFRKAGIPVFLKKAEEEGVPEWLQRNEPDEERLSKIIEEEINAITWFWVSFGSLDLISQKLLPAPLLMALITGAGPQL